MALTKMGLRAKSLLALALTGLLALLATTLVGWQTLEGVRNYFGTAFAVNLTQLNQQKIIAPVSRELALSQRLAQSEVTKAWLQDEQDPLRRAMFFREAEGYRHAFRGQSYFLISANSLGYFLNDAKQAFSDQPRYLVNLADPNDTWFIETLRSNAPYNINVNPDLKLKVTRVWFNIVVRDGDRRLGIAGTGLDLDDFLQAFVGNRQAGVTPMILDRQGAIQAHPDARLIAYNSGAQGSSRQTVFNLLSHAADNTALRAAMQQAEAQPQQVATTWAILDGQKQLFCVAYIPELKWHVVTAVDLHAAKLVQTRWLWAIVLVLLGLFVALLMGFAYAAERLVLAPLRRLNVSARAMAAGDYAVKLPSTSQDEIGELSEAFNVMALKVQQHTAELENRVEERTRALQQSNEAISQAHKKISDSIEYASLIQRAMLPVAHSHDDAVAPAVLWQPRDVVGGDFYLYRRHEHGCLFGVVDCAGHGVPGAMMTMLAHAAIDQAISVVGLSDPASLLQRTDETLRHMLRDTPGQLALATNMDVGFAYLDLRAQQVVFAGAKVMLYHSDGAAVNEVKAGRRALGDRRAGSFSNTVILLRGRRVFYLVTDGLLDQAGGEMGYSFGSSRFSQLVADYAAAPLAEQIDAFKAALCAYQGEHAQRDDITLLCFAAGH